MKRIGYIVIAALLLFGLCQAVYGLPGVMHSMLGGSAGGGPSTTGSWSSWNEASQETLNVDYVVFFDASNNGADETGYSASGEVTGTALTLTQHGNVVGSTDGSSRELDGVNDYFTYLNRTFGNSIRVADEYTAIWKLKSGNPRAEGGLFRAYSGDGLCRFDVRIGKDTAGAVTFWLDDQDNAVEERTTSDVMSGNSTYYVAVWHDGSETRAGFTSVRPTKLSDFASGASVLFTNQYSGFGVPDDQKYVGYIPTAIYLENTALYYMIMDSTCLIN